MRHSSESTFRQRRPSENTTNTPYNMNDGAIKTDPTTGPAVVSKLPIYERPDESNSSLRGEQNFNTLKQTVLEMIDLISGDRGILHISEATVAYPDSPHFPEADNKELKNRVFSDPEVHANIQKALIKGWQREANITLKALAEVGASLDEAMETLVQKAVDGGLDEVTARITIQGRDMLLNVIPLFFSREEVIQQVQELLNTHSSLNETLNSLYEHEQELRTDLEVRDVDFDSILEYIKLSFLDKKEYVKTETERKKIMRLKRLVEVDSNDMNSIITEVTGLDSPEAWDIRRYAVKKGAEIDDITRSIGDLDSEEAWNWREYALDNGTNLPVILKGILELDSLKALDMQRRLFGSMRSREIIFTDLKGVDSPEAWAIRKFALNHGVDPHIIVDSITGLDSPRAWDLREYALDNGVDLHRVVDSITGLDSQKAWDLREYALNHGVDLHRALASIDDLRRVLASINGLDSQKAWDLREFALNHGVDLHRVVRDTITGLDSQKAWDLREKLSENDNEDYWEKAYYMSMVGLDSPKAWAIRDLKLKNADRHDAVVYSIIGLDSPKAWAIRERLFNDPNAIGHAVNNTAGLDSPKAWAIRERYLEIQSNNPVRYDYHAFIFLLDAIKGLHSPRAQAMRTSIYKKTRMWTYI